MSNQSPHQPDQPVQNRWQQQPAAQWSQPAPAAPRVQSHYDQAFQQAPAPVPYQLGVPARYDMTAPRKSKTVALILALPFLPTSWLGIHNFYLGQTLRGVLHLVFALIGMVPLLWLVVDPIHFIFIVVELALIITGAGNYGRDRQGRPLV
ncbi:NINE protein [Corynebacterium nuruki]|uniref:NINE protein n=1 Tax=Corynebacterium nuruki TaxID=1032851 RepID=A0A3D4SXL4_9CORY|nr:NINE protein [Corynebacterium nuruki]HCT13767.1 NINE protein [Corynebacterium nuruki]